MPSKYYNSAKKNNFLFQRRQNMTDSAQNIQDPDHGFLRIQKNLTDRTSYSTLFRNLWLENLVVANTHGCLKSRTSLKVTSVLCRSTGDMRAVSYIWAPTRAMQNMAKRRESPVSWNTILKNERAICFQIQNPLLGIQVLYCTIKKKWNIGTRFGDTCTYYNGSR